MHKHNPPLDAQQTDLIRFEQHFGNPLIRHAMGLAGKAVSPLLGIGRINKIYRELSAAPASEPFGRILRLFDISYRITSDDLAKIPDNKPLVVIANHPFGGIEGIVLADLLTRLRPDTKVLGNYLLQRIEPIGESIIPVDPFGRKSSISANAKTFRTCLRWLKKGNCLIVFPAGEVSHISARQLRVADPAWSHHIASLVRMSGAHVLPIYFPGRNSLLFNAAGLVHPRLRTLMLGRELLAKRSSRISLFVGRSISPDKMKSFTDDKDLIRWLRFKTYFIANRLDRYGKLVKLPFTRGKKEQIVRELIPPVPRARMFSEVAALPEKCRLLTHKKMEVFIADSRQIPNMLQEIGRLREKTFREVGEGTGKPVDVDLFDSYYRHLILWNMEAGEIVGAYRIGDTTAILNRFGRKGLYTHSLFRFKYALMNHLTHSLELGRSFIRSEYQRQPNCLALLWKGIGSYLVQHPEYRILFGPVSISNSYQRISKQIMIQFLKRNCSSRELSTYVSPRCPFRMFPGRPLDHSVVGSIDDVSMLISEIESDGKRVPVLIKHYLKLNGQFIAFNVDRDFCNAVDGLVVVDLMTTDTRLLERFMGAGGAASYLEYWSEKRRREA